MQTLRQLSRSLDIKKKWFNFSRAFKRIKGNFEKFKFNLTYFQISFVKVKAEKMYFLQLIVKLGSYRKVKLYVTL